MPQIQSFLRVADILVVQQKTGEIPQAQFLVVSEVVDMPIYVQRQVPNSGQISFVLCEKWTPILRPVRN